MRFFKLSTLLAGIAVFIFGCSGNSANLNTSNSNITGTKAPANSTSPALVPPPLSGDLAGAKALYKEHCARCHQDNGEGGKVSSDIGSFTVPSFKRPSVMKEPDSEYLEVIVNGEEEMPSFRDKLTAEQIKDLVKVIRGLQSK